MAKSRENIYSFKKGFGLIPHKDIRRAKKEIMDSLKITSRTQWYQRLYGKIVPNIEEKEAIENIITKYKVKQSEIWGS